MIQTNKATRPPQNESRWPPSVWGVSSTVKNTRIHYNILCNLSSTSSHHRETDQWCARYSSKSPLFESHSVPCGCLATPLQHNILWINRVKRDRCLLKTTSQGCSPIINAFSRHCSNKKPLIYYNAASQKKRTKKKETHDKQTGCKKQTRKTESKCVLVLLVAPSDVAGCGQGRWGTLYFICNANMSMGIRDTFFIPDLMCISGHRRHTHTLLYMKHWFVA